MTIDVVLFVLVPAVLIGLGAAGLILINTRFAHHNELG
jgi:hypothetical protein